LAASLLVLRPPGGLHLNPSGYGNRFGGSLQPSAQTHLRISLDGAESGTFKEKWINNLDYYFTLGGYFGVGADLLTSNRTILSIRVGYDILPMKMQIDGSDQYNGALVRFGFNWKK